MPKFQSSFREVLKDAIYFLVGGCLYAGSIDIFTAPAHIAPGGISGISTVLNYLFGVPIGICTLVLNVPLFILAARFIGSKFLTKTIVATALSSGLIDLLAMFLPKYSGNGLLAAIYGGVTAGLGLALIFLRGGTTGGTDIAARLLQRIFHHIPVGKLMLAIDVLIITVSAVVYKSVDSGLYACIVMFTCTTIIDRLLYNADLGKVIYIVSAKPDEVTDAIIRDMDRGVTILSAKGGYSKEERPVLMCAVRQNEVWRLKQLVHTTDPTAFMIVTEAGQIMGEGFKQMNQE